MNACCFTDSPLGCPRVSGFPARKGNFISLNLLTGVREAPNVVTPEPPPGLPPSCQVQAWSPCAAAEVGDALPPWEGAPRRRSPHPLPARLPWRSAGPGAGPADSSQLQLWEASRLRGTLQAPIQPPAEQGPALARASSTINLAAMMLTGPHALASSHWGCPGPDPACRGARLRLWGWGRLNLLLPISG